MAARGTRVSWTGRVSVGLTVLAAAAAIVAGTAIALLGFVFPELGDDATAPSQSLPEGVERAADLPVLPTVLVVLALVLAVVAAGMALADDRARPVVARCALLVAGPIVLLVGSEVVPHVVSPCWAGDVPQLCEPDGHGGHDYARTVHPFGHALLGWVPLTIVYVVALRRGWPAVVPRWLPGAAEEHDVAAGTSGAGRPGH